MRVRVREEGMAMDRESERFADATLLALTSQEGAMSPGLWVASRGQKRRTKQILL